jgi:DNA-directed RNA polymerase specialized sigma24 family protein
MFTQEESKVDEEVLNRETIRWLLQKLMPEEQDILVLWAVEQRSFTDIGKIVGEKYHGNALPDTTIRYRKDRIMQRLREYRVEVGL